MRYPISLAHSSFPLDLNLAARIPQAQKHFFYLLAKAKECRVLQLSINPASLLNLKLKSCLSLERDLLSFLFRRVIAVLLTINTGDSKLQFSLWVALLFKWLKWSFAKPADLILHKYWNGTSTIVGFTFDKSRILTFEEYGINFRESSLLTSPSSGNTRDNLRLFYVTLGN